MHWNKRDLLLNLSLWIYVICIKADTDRLENLLNKLSVANDAIKQTLHRTMLKWEVKNYPNFLRSAALPKESWDLMKMKLQLRILDADAQPGKAKWTIAFMGSSVTAGRDSPMNATFVSLTEKYMGTAFKVIDIELRCNHNAHEANPCIPYNLCVPAYAGAEADIVHWEQSYNCGGNAEATEYFIRGALSLPSRPIVVFSDSGTENWKKEACVTPPTPYQVTQSDHEMIKLFQEKPKALFTENNYRLGHLKRGWYHFDHYKAAGIQSFYHQEHQQYKCQGPFGADFGCCGAAWHPSRKGHQLRAGHHALLWLSILRDAVVDLKHSVELQTSAGSLEALRSGIAAKIESYYTGNVYLPPKKMTGEMMPDGVQCWTEYEPRSDHSTSLSDALINTTIASTYALGLKGVPDWHIVVSDRLVYGDYGWNQAQLAGYKDYKVLSTIPRCMCTDRSIYE